MWFRDFYDIECAFANTGCEHPATLEYVNACDKYWGFNVVWLEAEISPKKGIGVRHKIVTYETASRNGEPFEAYIAKYGIPNQWAPHCTSRLKTEVMESYLRTKGFRRGKKLNYETAIGIRADEMDRVSARAKEYGIIYPLIRKGYTKQDVLNEVSTWPFQLRLPGEHFGNCQWCWKKSFRKLMTLAVDAPEVFDFPRRMELKYGDFKTENATGGVRVFYRGARTVESIFESAKQPFEKYADAIRSLPQFDPVQDREFDCGASCEIS